LQLVFTVTHHWIARLPALSRIYRFSEWVWCLCRAITGNPGEP